MVWAIGLWVAAATLAAVTVRQGIGPHDEGLMLAWAGRIADGQWPYRDFWCNYGPGQPVLIAALVKLLGPSLLWWRLLRVAIGATVALLAFRLVRREAALPWALAAWVGAAGAMAWPLTPGPAPTALALAFAGLLAAPRRPALAGALCGAAAVFRPEIGAAAALGVVVTGTPKGSLAWAIGVAVAGWLPFVLVAPHDALHDTFGFVTIQGLQRLPLQTAPHSPDPNKLLETLFPSVLYAGTLAYAAWAVRARRWLLAPLIVAGALYLTARADEFHLVPLSAVLAVALAVAAAREDRRALQVLLSVPLALIALHGLDRQAGRVLHPEADATVPGPVADGVRTTQSQQAALGTLVQQLGATRAPLLVLPPRTDRVRFGAPLLNVLLRRPNPTRYDVMQPGVVTTRAVQQEMVADLKATRTPTIVRWLAPAAGATEPNGSGRSSGVTVLDDYVARAYRPAFRAGDYAVLVLRGRGG